MADRQRDLEAMDTMTPDDEKQDRIVRLIAEQLGVPEDKVRSHLAADDFAAFAVDSLDVMELVSELDDELTADGPDE